MAVQRFFTLPVSHYNELITNAKVQPRKSNGIKGQKTCLWCPTPLTLPANLHAIENQCHALRKNDDGGVSENRNFFLTRHRSNNMGTMMQAIAFADALSCPVRKSNQASWLPRNLAKEQANKATHTK